MKVLLTGGAGYIGSHTAKVLSQAGYQPVIYDNLSTGFLEAVPADFQLIKGDVRDKAKLTQVLSSEKIQAVIHFAAKLSVKESVLKPLEYYDTNTGGMIALLESMQAAQVKNIVFSSTAALFGDAIQNRPIREDDVKSPLNPYGTSKLMSELILEDARQTEAIRYCSLRYFNVAGASEDLSGGQRTIDASHLIHLGVQAATGKRAFLELFGTDYPTKDGSCIRDYIHVQDLADIHLLALNKLLKDGISTHYNCGYGVGYSVREVIAMIKKVSGVDFKVVESLRRQGDASSLIADSSKLKKELNWQPKRNSLELICRTAYEWEIRAKK